MAESGKTLDVRLEMPAHRHELIFRTYSALAPGDRFVRVDDHGGTRPYYQFASQHVSEFECDPFEQGPQVGCVQTDRPAR